MFAIESMALSYLTTPEHTPNRLACRPMSVPHYAITALGKRRNVAIPCRPRLALGLASETGIALIESRGTDSGTGVGCA